MNKFLADKKQTIIEYLIDSLEPHLADCIDLIPVEHIHSLYDAIMTNRGNKVRRSVTADMVVQDVAAVLEGKPENAEFSKPFLKAL